LTTTPSRCGARHPVADEASGLQPLGPQTLAAAVEVQHLDLRGAPIDEGEQLPVQRVLLLTLARQRVKMGLLRTYFWAMTGARPVANGKKQWN
jgi:hypothetical protein